MQGVDESSSAEESRPQNLAEESAGSLRRSLPRGQPSRIGTSANLSSTATALLAAARRVLEKSGFTALSYEAVGLEAGMSPNLIRYHFKNKDGLLAALLDWLMLETLWQVRRHMSELRENEGGIEAVAEDLASWLSHPESYTLFYDLVPHFLRDPQLKRELGEMYGMSIATYAEALSDSTMGDAVSEEAEMLAAMTMAMLDGLALQVLARPDRINVSGCISLWREYLAARLERISGNADEKPPVR